MAGVGYNPEMLYCLNRILVRVMLSASLLLLRHCQKWMGFVWRLISYQLQGQLRRFDKETTSWGLSKDPS